MYFQKEKPFFGVKSNLSVTPAQMDTLREQGIPITAATLPDELFNDGSDNPQFEVPLEMQRGIDIAELWQNSETSRKRISKFNKEQ